MIFNFVLANHHETSLNSLGDLVEPICQGLEQCGHHVIRYGIDLHQAPAVNVLVEFFKDDAIVDDFLRFKRDHGDRFVLGLIGTEDPDDRLVMDNYPNRRRNLERIAAAADFVWTLLPVEEFYRQICGADRVRLLRYGFSERCVEPDMIGDPKWRDIDAVLYGNAHPYRQRIVDALAAHGLTCVCTQREAYPDYVAADLIRRAKVLLDVRRGPEVRYLSPTRILRGLHSGTMVLSERFDAGPLSYLYDYTVASPYDELAERCHALIKSGGFVERGFAALAKFRAETSMRDSMARALEVPALRRLLAAEPRR